MGQLIKVVLIFLSSSLVLIMVATIAILLIVDLNTYKAEIEKIVKDKTGRALKIEGDLNLYIFPWLGVSTGKMLLSNVSGFAKKPFAVIDKADIKVKLLPLFFQQIEVSTIVLNGLELHLEKNKQGFNNWDFSVAKATKNSFVATKQAHYNKTIKAQMIQPRPAIKALPLDLAGIKINSLVIENSQVSWNDQQSGRHIVIKDFNFSTDSVIFNKPIAIKVAFLLQNTDPAITSELTLSTRLTTDATLQNMQLDNLKLDSVSRGESIPNGVLKAQLLATIAMDLQAQTLLISDLQLSMDAINLTGNISATQLKTAPYYTGKIRLAPFSPKALMQQFAISTPAMTDEKVLQKFAMSFDLQGSKDLVALENLNITLDNTHIKGDARIKHFARPAITFQLAIDDIDIGRYSTTKKQSKLAKEPIAKAKFTVNKIPLLPMDTLRSLNINGNLKVAKLNVAKLKMAEVNLNTQAKEGILKIKYAVNQLYQGNSKGQIIINSTGKLPRIAFNKKITGVQLEPLLNDFQPDSKAKLKARINMSARLKTTGNTMSAIKSNLGGTLNLSLDNGAIRGFNLQKIIEVGRLVIKGKKMQHNDADEQTLFTMIKASATINKGLINNPDFLAESSTVEVKGEGEANLVNETLNYNVVAKARKGGNKITARPIAINIQGTFSKPSYGINLSSIQSMISAEEKQKINKLIDKTLGEGTGKAVDKLLKGFF